MVELISKPAPARVNGRPSSSLGTIHQEGYPIFLYESALDQIIEFSERELSRELGGFLLGGIYKDKRDYIEIEHFLPAVEARSQLASFTFTHDTWAEMNRSVALKYPDKTVVGWHHTHPGFGIFLSSYDMFIHRNFFTQPWQVAMVVDPKRHEFGFFQWVGEDVVDCGFICVPSSEK